MRFIPTKVHGALDYLTGLLLVIGPFFLWETREGADMWLPMLLGAGIIVYSVWTDYEWGAFKSLSMRTHLMLDLMGGVLLAVSPWLFGFADHVYLPHLLIGLFEIGSSLFTQREPRHYGKLGADTL